MKTQYSIALIVCAALSGCKAVGPDYVRPQTELPARFIEQTDGEIHGQEKATREWWKSFHDPILDQLIADAQSANPDIKIAIARVRQARAQLSVDEAAGDISAVLSGSAARSLNSANVEQIGANGSRFSPGGVPFSLYKVGFDAAWEIDLFGGIRRSNEAAAANFQASVESGRDVLISLYAEVARNYIDLRASQQQLLLAQHTLKNLQDTLKLTQQRHTAGLINEADVANIETQLAAARATLLPLQTAGKKSMHRLSVLLGKAPQSLRHLLAQPAAIPVSNAAVEVGLPSELLLRRPDVRRAERDVARATAEIGVATADLYPHFNLAASVGLQSSNADDLLSGNSKVWSVAPGFTLPLFGRDKIRDNISIFSTAQDQALLTYQSTVLTALEDVENALVEYHNQQQQLSDLTTAYVANQLVYRLAQQRYQGGLSSMLEVLASERNLLATQTQLTQAETSRTATPGCLV
jgi:efflux transporter, outer membrane factor (OMF) lipoprotein, NodT family